MTIWSSITAFQRLIENSTKAICYNRNVVIMWKFDNYFREVRRQFHQHGCNNS